MPRYFLRVPTGRYAGASELSLDAADRDAAWAEATGVCGDLIAGVFRSLEQNAEWHMELLDESREPLFRIRLVAETLK